MNARRLGLWAAMIGAAWTASAGAQERRVDAPWRVSVEAGARWHHDGGLDAFGSSRSPVVTGLMVARDLVRVGDRATLSLDVGWNAESFEGRLRDALATRLTTHTMSAGVTLRVQGIEFHVETFLARLACINGAAEAAVRTVHRVHQTCSCLRSRSPKYL